MGMTGAALTLNSNPNLSLSMIITGPEANGALGDAGNFQFAVMALDSGKSCRWDSL